DISIRLQPKADPAAMQKNGQIKVDRVAADVMAALKAKRPDVSLKQPPDFIGPQVGAELRNSGVIAVIVVIVGIMIYLGLRFEKRFAVAALASEVHDTLITVGIIAAVQREFDMTVLASVLAVVGYSINDKVVVFDRVREMFRITRKAEPALHGFAITMLIGILVGTLSSIFFANPILLWLGVSKKDLMPVTKENPEL